MSAQFRSQSGDRAHTCRIEYVRDCELSDVIISRLADQYPQTGLRPGSTFSSHPRANVCLMNMRCRRM